MTPVGGHHEGMMSAARDWEMEEIRERTMAGESSAEIASALGISDRTVKRARRRMRLRRVDTYEAASKRVDELEGQLNRERVARAEAEAAMRAAADEAHDRQQIVQALRERVDEMLAQAKQRVTRDEVVTARDRAQSAREARAVEREREQLQARIDQLGAELDAAVKARVRSEKAHARTKNQLATLRQWREEYRQTDHYTLWTLLEKLSWLCMSDAEFFDAIFNGGLEPDDRDVRARLRADEVEALNLTRRRIESRVEGAFWKSARGQKLHNTWRAEAREKGMTTRGEQDAYIHDRTDEWVNHMMSTQRWPWPVDDASVVQNEPIGEPLA